MILLKNELEHQLLDDYAARDWLEEDQADLNMKSIPKAFFSFAKSRHNVVSKVGPFLDPSTGMPNLCPKFAASELSSQYSSVFVPAREEWKVTNPNDFFKHSGTEQSSGLVDINNSEGDIKTACSELKSNSAAGADGVPASLLINCRNELSKPLFLLWMSL